MKKDTPDWKARRKGNIYCAPACGGNCTWAAYQQAKRDSLELVRELGTGWTAHVWENLGWHWEVRDASNCLNVVVGRTGRFTAYLGEGGGGSRWFDHGKSPQAAIRGVIRQAKRELEGIKKLVVFVESAI